MACLGTFAPQVTRSLFVTIFVKCVVSVCYDTIHTGVKKYAEVSVYK